MKTFQSNCHDLIFNWRPVNQITKFEYFDTKPDNEITQDRVKSLVAVPTLANYISAMDAPRFKYKILIVDDQSFNIEAMKIILHYCIGLNTHLYC